MRYTKEKWVIYTASQSSMQSIEYSKENHPILNQIYNNLTELKAQDKKIKLCKVPAHMEIKGNEEADKTAKEAIYMPGVTTIVLPYTDYYLTIRKAKNSEWQSEWKIVITNYTALSQALKSGRVPKTVVCNMRLS